MRKILVGYRRDRAIMEAVETHRALNTDQIHAFFFSHLSTGRRKAQARLRTLVDRKKLQRIRVSSETPYVYYIDAPVNQLEHLTMLNWVVLWLLKSLNAWESAEKITYERTYGNLRADAVIEIKNTILNKVRVVFVEMDRAESNNPMDKVPKYNALYENQELLVGEEWYAQIERFPSIIIATTTKVRLSKIDKSIKEENRNNLIIRSKLLDDLVKEVAANENTG